MRNNFIIMTNNALVADKYSNFCEIIYEKNSCADFFESLLSKIQSGHILLTHPLSGSVKPGETPFKSVLISKRLSPAEQHAKIEDLNFSMHLTNNALTACRKFKMRPDRFAENVIADLQLIDLTLIESAIDSAQTQLF